MAWGSGQGHRDRCTGHEVFCWIRKDNLCYRNDFCHPSMGHGGSVPRTTPLHNVLSAGGTSLSLISRGSPRARCIRARHGLRVEGSGSEWPVS